jgi:glyoxylase-like metal-dependent hydrolase (beta-lactamase superfamily II)
MASADFFQTVAPDLWVWEVFEDSVRTNLGSTAVRTAHGLVLIDPVDLVAGALEELTEEGPLIAVVLTNGNHARASARFRSRFSLPILAHADAVSELSVPVDGMLEEGAMVGGLQVIELKGAGPGELALYDPRGRLHFGDAVVNLESTGLSLLPAKYCSNQRELRNSLQKLIPLHFHLATFAHGTPVAQDAKALLDRVVSAE